MNEQKDELIVDKILDKLEDMKAKLTKGLSERRMYVGVSGLEHIFDIIINYVKELYDEVRKHEVD